MSLAKQIMRLSKGRDYGQAFVEAMDSSIRELAIPRKSKANIKPSKAHCLREMYYILISGELDGLETVDPDMYLIQRDGSDMHNTIQNILLRSKNYGIEMLDPAEEVKKAQQMGINTIIRESSHPDDNSSYEIPCFNTDYNISFRFDGIIRFLNKKAILEIKNEDHFKWTKRLGPEEDHILQVTFYSICLGINYVLLLYVDRNYRKRKGYLVEISEDMKDKQIYRIKLVHYCAENNILPSKEPGKHCRYCNFKTICQKDGDVSHEGLISNEFVDKYKISPRFLKEVKEEQKEDQEEHFRNRYCLNPPEGN